MPGAGLALWREARVIRRCIKYGGGRRWDLWWPGGWCLTSMVDAPLDCCGSCCVRSMVGDEAMLLPAVATVPC